MGEAPVARLELHHRVRITSYNVCYTKLLREIWSEVLRLIYSGNMHAARQYFDLAWPKERNDKNEVVDDFRKTLAGSPYSRDVLAMNNGESF